MEEFIIEEVLEIVYRLVPEQNINETETRQSTWIEPELTECDLELEY